MEQTNYLQSLETPCYILNKEELKRSIEEKNVLVHDLEEQNKDYELIIKAYQKFAEHERKRSDEQYEKTFDLKEELENLGNPS